jgi:uncharacterized membrane protein
VHDTALFLHILGAFTLAGGIIVAGIAFEAARRRSSPDEIALLLGLTRVGAAAIGVGTLLVLICGLWLVHLDHLSLRTRWIEAALAVLVVMIVLGALGGQRPKQARRLAQSDGGSSGELRALLDDPWSRAANYAAAACVLVILWLMVSKPTL